MNESEKKIVELQFAYEQQREAKARLISNRIGYTFLFLGLGCGFFISFFRGPLRTWPF